MCLMPDVVFLTTKCQGVFDVWLDVVEPNSETSIAVCEITLQDIDRATKISGNFSFQFVRSFVSSIWIRKLEF